MNLEQYLSFANNTCLLLNSIYYTKKHIKKIISKLLYRKKY